MLDKIICVAIQTFNRFRSLIRQEILTRKNKHNKINSFSTITTKAAVLCHFDVYCVAGAHFGFGLMGASWAMHGCCMLVVLGECMLVGVGVGFSVQNWTQR